MENLPESPSQSSEESSPVYDSAKGLKHDIDTAAPFESVKDAVSKFGGIVDWKTRRTQSLERSKMVGHEFAKPSTTEELENTKKLIEELRVNLESVERDEVQVKEEAELVIRKIEELEQDIADEASFEAKAQLEVEQSMQSSAASELEFLKKELDSLRREYDSMVNGRDVAINNAEEAVAASKEIEKAVEDLNAELIATKESLNLTRTAHLEAEEQTSGVIDEETRNCKLELEKSEEELETLNQQVLSARVLKSKLEASSSLLLDLKAELAAYMESKLEDETDILRKKELEEVKMNIEKATAEVNSLKEASILLQSELEEEKLSLNKLKESEERASAKVTDLQVELEKSKSAIAFLQMKENEAREVMAELPKKLQAAVQEADEAKSLSHAAQAELLQAQEEAERAKANLATLQNRLRATKMEIGASKVSEKLAKDSIKALERSESTRGGSNKKEVDTSSLVTLTLDEYHELSKRTQKAEEQANLRIAAANSQIEMAKESELRSLEKLEELNEELCVRRESLKIATENAEKAAEGKSAVEHELRSWRADQEQQRKDSEVNTTTAAAPTVNVNDSSHTSKGKAPLENNTNNDNNNNNSNESGSSSDAKNKKKKKKSLFPSKVIMFFAKRKTHPSK
ncbi:protein WEAK CHLOROPLAST MOVEMENT UNDER BLUE LIGHT 1-like [Vicia villosa]|uniref:protein WEAK CHLOROPLAST MOVEMENT UNDER BLUE LIGHT 1-like n=1 Tax=Vicia villosa TaxID=3911 RepID=UPI00273C9DE8|nr:protein WEAK CHLOROPLAST MOVEMENT UNDER BLUE LIGHT 1-like [Vicia villosa]